MHYIYIFINIYSPTSPLLLQGVIINKCARWNYLNTNHFKNSIIWGLLLAWSWLIWTYILQQFTPRASANSSLMMVQTNPSQLVIKLSWDSERLARSIFTLWQSKTSIGAKLGEKDGWRLVLPLSLPFGLADWGGGVDWHIIPAQKLVLGWQSRPFHLESCPGLHQSLLDADFVNGFTARLFKQWQQKNMTSEVINVILVIFPL